MKTARVLFSLDLVRTLYTGFTNIRQENKEESEQLETIKKSLQTTHWKPLVGVGIFIVGSALFILGKKK